MERDDSLGSLERARVTFKPLSSLGGVTRSMDAEGAGGGHIKVYETALLEKEAHQTGAEFDSLRQINQTLATCAPIRPGSRPKLRDRRGEPVPEQPFAPEDHENRRVEHEPVDPMITTKKPKEIPLTWWERMRLRWSRVSRHTIWRACLMHHKLFSLHLDNQNFVCSAPERVALFHASLWLNALLLALMLWGATTFRPGEDPFCTQLGALPWRCLLYWPAVLLAAVSAVLTLILSNLCMILVRGRSFPARTRNFTEEERERAFIHHMLGRWPLCWLEPNVPQVALGNWKARLLRRPVKPFSEVFEHPLEWQPSAAFLLYMLLLPLLAVLLLLTMFYYSSSKYMEEVTYSNRPGFFEHNPPLLERAEAYAAASARSMEGIRVVIPLLQRYIILLILAWCLHLFVLEPLLLAVHLFVGEPSIDYTARRIKERLRACSACLRRCCWSCCICCCGCCPARCCCGRRLAEPSPRSGNSHQAQMQQDSEESEDESNSESSEDFDPYVDMVMPGQPSTEDTAAQAANAH